MMPVYRHAAVHFPLALVAFTLWAAADSWYLLTGLGIASVLSIITAIVAGTSVSLVIHEWLHFAGAAASGAAYKIPAKQGLFVFDFNYGENSLRQFNIMSWTGQAGSWLIVAALLLAIPLDNAGRVMLVAAAIGNAVFGAAIEWPVLRRAQASGDPLAELSKIDKDVLMRSFLMGVAAAVLFWLWVS